MTPPLDRALAVEALAHELLVAGVWALGIPEPIGALRLAQEAYALAEAYIAEGDRRAKEEWRP